MPRSATPGAVVSSFSIFDVLASIFLMLVMMRRLEVRSLAGHDHPGVSRGRFDDWRARSMRAYAFVALVCVAKIALGQLWIAVAMPQVPRALTVVSGLIIDGAWVVALVMSWKKLTDLRLERQQLGLSRSVKRG